jgi:hypothetical protein
MSVNSKMTAIADEIRELSGTTGTMGLDAMANTLHTENSNFASNLTAQDSLIAQIQTALEGKAGSSSGEDVTSETNAYTNKLTTLETAITTLENELQGKASGGSGGRGIETCTVTLNIADNAYTNPCYLIVTTIENGIISPKFISETALISNAVKNSEIHILYPEDGIMEITSSNGNYHIDVTTTSMNSPSGMLILHKIITTSDENITIDVD